MPNQTDIGNGFQAVDLRPVYNGGYSWRALSDITTLLLHHSGVLAHADADASQAIASINRAHLANPNIGATIAYHFVIDPYGETYYVGDILTTRFHARNANPFSIGVCVLGDYSVTRPKTPVVGRILDTIAALQFSMGGLAFVPHRSYVATQCPGQAMIDALNGWQGVLDRWTEETP